MDLHVDRSELARALSLTRDVVDRKTTMPILVNLLLSAEEGCLKVSATDLEVTTVTSLKADVQSGGSTTVNARVFNEIIRELPDGKIHLQLLDGERVEISSGNARLKVVGVGAGEYPGLPGIDTDASRTIQSQDFLEMIGKTLYAVSQDETRFHLNGVCFEFLEEDKKSLFRMIATDGHRLAMISSSTGKIESSQRVIVPKKGLAEIRKALEETDAEKISFDITSEFLIVETQNTKISVRLVDGEFPDYRAVVPQEPGVPAKMPVQKFSAALRRVALMVSDREKCVKCDFSPGKLNLSSSSPELGEAVEEIEIDYTGDVISAGFNARYMLDFTSSIGDDGNLILELHGSQGPGKLMVENNNEYTAVIMPMRLKEEKRKAA